MSLAPHWAESTTRCPCGWEHMKNVEATWQSRVASVVFSTQLSMHAISPEERPLSCPEHTLFILSPHRHSSVHTNQPYTTTTPPPYSITNLPQLMDISHQEEQRGSSSPESRIVRLKTEPGTSTTRQSPRPSSSSNATTAGSSNRPVQPPKVCDKCRLRSKFCLFFFFRSDSTYPEHMA